jgi:3',5'-cyclic AMP phosphodiesterase CpdA
MTMLIAQITDMHLKGEGELLYGRIDTTAFLERAVAHVNALDPRPDIVLATGDLVDNGSAEQYANLKRVLAPLRMPVFMIPGNHDARGAMRAAFPEHRYLPADGFLQYTVEGLPVRLLALDTLVEGKGHGELCDERLDWLKARLAESDRPTLLFMHHPPFACGIAYLDGARLNKGEQRLSELVRAHGNVERVICGHVHRPIQVRWAGTLASTAPSTAHQATLDLRPVDTLSMMMEPPGISLHLWREGTGLISHVSYVGNYDGPSPFRAM